MSSEALLLAWCSHDVLSLTRPPCMTLETIQYYGTRCGTWFLITMTLYLCFSECVLVWQFGFRKWKSHVTERPIEDRSDQVKELYSEQIFIKPYTGQWGIVSWRSRVQHLASWTNDFCYNALDCPWISCVYFFPFRLTDHRWQHCIYPSLRLVALFSLLSC